MSIERDQRRAIALANATELFAGIGIRQIEDRPAYASRTIARHVIDVAELFEHWLARPAPIVTAILIADTPIDRNSQEDPMSLAMPDTKKVTIRARAEDEEGALVPDDFTDATGPYLAPFTWVLDNTAIGQMTVAGDTLSADVESVPGQVGTVTLVATDVNGKALPPFTIEIDPGAAVSAALVADTPVDRTDTPAPAAGA